MLLIVRTESQTRTQTPRGRSRLPPAPSPAPGPLRDPLPSIPARRPRPRPLTQHGQPAAGPESQGGGCRAQPRGSPPKPGPRRSPSTRSLVPRPKNWVSPSRPRSPAQKPRRAAPLTQHGQLGTGPKVELSGVRTALGTRGQTPPSPTRDAEGPALSPRRTRSQGHLGRAAHPLPPGPVPLPSTVSRVPRPKYWSP